MSDTQNSLSDLTGVFIAGLPVEQKVAVHAELSRFVRWFGASRQIDEITSQVLESYQDQVLSSGADTNRRLEPVKDFLTFARQQGHLDVNMAKHVKLRRASSKKKGERKGGVLVEESVQLTPEGYARLQAELEDLVTRVRAEVSHELEEARRDRDIRENAPYDAAKDRQAMVEARIRDLQRIMATASMLEKNGSTERVSIGSHVVLQDLTFGGEVAYTMVSTNEAKPSQGLLSVSSPVGRALVDRTQGSSVEVSTPGGTVCYRIERIER